MSVSPFADWMAATQARVEAALARHLPGNECIPARLHDAMRYATLGGGKSASVHCSPSPPAN